VVAQGARVARLPAAALALTVGYRAAFFAVPTDELPLDDLLERLPSATLDASTWNTFAIAPVYFARKAPRESQGHVYTAISTDADAKRSGLRYFFLGCNDRHWDYWYKHHFADFAAAFKDVTLLTLSHNDKEAIYFFERRAPKAPKLFWLLSAGHMLGGTVNRVSVRYAKKKQEYDDAITIGLRQYFPRARHGEYLELLHAKKVWRYNAKDAAKLVDRPGDFTALIGRIPSTSQIRRAGLAGEVREWIS
jgi:hypothetical protein